MEKTNSDGNLSNNIKIENEFDDCTNYKVYVNKTISSEEYVKQEPCDMQDQQPNIKNIVNIKDENIDGPAVVVKEIEFVQDTRQNLCNNIKSKMKDTFEDYTNNEVYINKLITNEGCVKKEPYDMEDQQENIYNHVSIKKENVKNIDDRVAVVQETKTDTKPNMSNNNNNSKIQDEFDDCTDDKISIHETLISRGYIKQEPCEMESEQSLYNCINIKEKSIDCEECGQACDLYCLKCPMLIRIFDTNNPNKTNRVRQTLPKNFIDICETSSGVCIIALKVIPKGVVFGPFGGLDSIKDGAVSKWKLKHKELAYIKDPTRLNWMQYIRKADEHSHGNLTPFQYEDELYYRSECHINVGDELLVYWDSDNEKRANQNTEDSYLEPQVCGRLDDTYACTLCCVGYKSISHLTAHNSGCTEKRNQKDFCKEIIRCAFCKIYLDKKEYSDYHMDRCCESNTMKYIATPRSPEDTDKPEPKNKYKCSLCEYSTSIKDKFTKHQLTHTDLRMYQCPECPYRAGTNYRLQAHLRRHGKCSRFECEYCGKRFARFDYFAIHQKKKHFVHQLETHKDDKPYSCNTCGKQFDLKNSLVKHVGVCHNGEKKYKCPKCDFETIYPRSIKSHLLNMHSGVQRFKCTRCAFKTCYKKSLDRHVCYHENTKSIKCEHCDMEFWNTQSFIRHGKTVHAIVVNTYRCRDCEYRTRCKDDFKRHLIVHDGLKPIACILCSYKTNTNVKLKRHIAIVHNDGKPFTCPLCPYKTNTNVCLKVHVAVTHNDNTPFKCDMCAQMFKRKTSLLRHTRNIHSEAEKREYNCPQCSFETNYKTSFKYHMNTHNEGELFQCSKCDFNSHHKVAFRKHERRHEQTKKQTCHDVDKIPAENKIFNNQEGSKSLDCPTCGTTFNYKVHLARHIKCWHGSNVSERKPLIECDD